MPRATAEAAALTAAQILDAAARQFADQGFSGVTLDLVAAEAKVTRGAVYHHYRNKAGLFGAVVARLQEQVASTVAATAGEAGADPVTQLRDGSHAFLDAVTDRSMVRILLVEAPAVLGWAQWRRLDEKNSGTHLVEALHSVGAPPDLVPALAAQLSGAMNEAALWVAEHQDSKTALAQAHRALDGLLDSVTAAL